MKIVISQPMFIPWRGIFEQLKLSDRFVFFDDVQMPRGSSFINRVQIKSQRGWQWLTVPINRHKDSLINEVQIDDRQNWRDKHLRSIKYEYKKTSFYGELLCLMEAIYSYKAKTLVEFNVYAFKQIAKYLGLDRKFVFSSNLQVNEKSSLKLLKICKCLNGRKYITGHGALNYIEYDLFEKESVKVEYMDYLNTPYFQLHKEFNPYVSIIDLIGNCGEKALSYLTSQTVYWKDFLKKKGL